MMTIVTRVKLKQGSEPGWVGAQLLLPLDRLDQRVIAGHWQTRADWEAWHNDPLFVETRRRLDGLEVGPRAA